MRQPIVCFSSERSLPRRDRAPPSHSPSFRSRVERAAAPPTMHYRCADPSFVFNPNVLYRARRDRAPPSHSPSLRSRVERAAAPPTMHYRCADPSFVFNPKVLYRAHRDRAPPSHSPSLRSRVEHATRDPPPRSTAASALDRCLRAPLVSRAAAATARQRGAGARRARHDPHGGARRHPRLRHGAALRVRDRDRYIDPVSRGGASGSRSPSLRRRRSRPP